MSIVKLEGVWKKFTLHHQRTRSIKQAIVDVVSPFRAKQSIDAFWALKGVDLEMAKGETLGVIGSNGSGKSTLLKLVVGISRPDKGRVHVDGRVSALLELGAGFHPDFSGRENVFLNGAILGLPKKEIARRFDEIVEFAEIGNFIDNPVRTYSSGMYMRLAFSIAIHVDPDILVVDEVLAVGDSAFQNKCFNQIRRFKDEGKSILFVSHDLSSVRRFCDRAIWLDRGVPMAEGPVEEVANLYGAHMANLANPAPQSESIPIHFESGRVLNDQEVLRQGEGLQLEVNYRNTDPHFQPVLQLRINRQDGLCCYSGSGSLPPRGTSTKIHLQIDQLPLLSGHYYCEIVARDADGLLGEEISFSLPFTVSSEIPGEGIVPLKCHWEYSPSIILANF